MAKQHIRPIEEGNVRLRLLEASDLPMTLAWRNQDRIRRWFGHSEIITSEEHRAWFEKYMERDDDFVFIIEETLQLRKPVGQVSLYNIDWAQRQAEFGRLLIGEKNANRKGLARKATWLALDYGHKGLGLQEFSLEMKRENTAAYAIYLSISRSKSTLLSVDVAERDNLIVMRVKMKYPSGRQREWGYRSGE